MSDQPHVLRQLCRSRSNPVTGDYFAIKLDLGYLFGRVVDTKARWAEGDHIKDANLIYIFRRLWPEMSLPDTAYLLPGELLIPPMVINDRPWSMGYFEKVASASIEPAEKLARHYFRDVRNRYFDEYAVEVQNPSGPVGVLGLESFLTVDSAVEKALDTGRVVAMS